MVVFTEPCGRVVVNIRNIKTLPRCPRLIFIEGHIIMFPLIVLRDGWSTANDYVTITVYLHETPIYPSLELLLLHNNHRGPSISKYDHCQSSWSGISVIFESWWSYIRSVIVIIENVQNCRGLKHATEWELRGRRVMKN